MPKKKYCAYCGETLTQCECERCGDCEQHIDDCVCYMQDMSPEDFEAAGYLADGTQFADPGGNSALRAAGPGNPRNLPCPTCRVPNRLTPADEARGYQCDSCADRAEMGLDY